MGNSKGARIFDKNHRNLQRCPDQRRGNPPSRGSAVSYLNANNIVAVEGTTLLANGTAAGTSGPNVTVNSGATVLFNGAQRISNLNILRGGTARMMPDRPDDARRLVVGRAESSRLCQRYLSL